MSIFIEGQRAPGPRKELLTCVSLGLFSGKGSSRGMFTPEGIVYASLAKAQTTRVSRCPQYEKWLGSALTVCNETRKLPKREIRGSL